MCAERYVALVLCMHYRPMLPGNIIVCCLILRQDELLYQVSLVGTTIDRKRREIAVQTMFT